MTRGTQPMIPKHVHGVVPSHASPAAVPHWRFVQHGLVGEHAWPAAEHVDPDSQVPLTLPPGMRQPSPAQQSAGDVQVCPWGWQTLGAAHVPLLQMPEQQAAPEPQALPFAAQVPASVVPPVPASGVAVPPSGYVSAGRQA